MNRLEHGDGGILDLDDVLCDVADDKDRVCHECAFIFYFFSGDADLICAQPELSFLVRGINRKQCQNH